MRSALGLPFDDARPNVADIPPRPPRLCSGCPRCDTYHAVVKAGGGDSRPYLFGDIGCYTLAALPPHNAIDTCVDMGASIGMAIGSAEAGAHPVVATNGDSTFIHSGMSALIGAVHDDLNITVVILDNAFVAMTGGREVFATGDDLIRIIRGLGVSDNRISRLKPVPDAHPENMELIRRETEHRGLSVIVAQRACVHAQRRAK